MAREFLIATSERECAILSLLRVKFRNYEKICTYNTSTNTYTYIQKTRYHDRAKKLDTYCFVVGKQKGGQKVTGLSTLPVDRDAPGLRGDGRAAAALGWGERGGLEEVAERQVMAVIAAGPGVSAAALVPALLRGRTLPLPTVVGRGTAATTLGEMTGQGSPHVSFRSLSTINDEPSSDPNFLPFRALCVLYARISRRKGRSPRSVGRARALLSASGISVHDRRPIPGAGMMREKGLRVPHARATDRLSPPAPRARARWRDASLVTLGQRSTAAPLRRFAADCRLDG